MKYNINTKTINILKNFEEDNSYFFTPNQFYLSSIKIGPFTTEKKLTINSNDFMNTALKLKSTQRFEKIGNEHYTITVSILSIIFIINLLGL